MSAATDSPTPNAVVRFRLRTLLWLTTALAVLAAIAGPYFRLQSPEGQRALLLYWAFVGLFTSAGCWHAWRGLWKRVGGAGRLDFIMWLAPRRYWGPLPRAARNVMLIACCFVLVMTFSRGLVEDARVQRLGWGLVGSIVLIHGMIIGWLMSFLPSPVRLHVNGIIIGKQRIPWAHVRSAEWAWSRTDVVRLSLLDGDFYASVPRELRAVVEQYLRTKTTFIGRSVLEGSAHLAPGQ